MKKLEISFEVVPAEDKDRKELARAIKDLKLFDSIEMGSAVHVQRVMGGYLLSLSTNVAIYIKDTPDISEELFLAGHGS
jgi:hypothetical protein